MRSLRIRAARDRQRGFVADAAHELRSPLASMRTQLEVAQRLGEAGELPAELLVDVARLSRLVEDLLLLARADAFTGPPATRESFDAAALLAEVADRYTAARVPVTVGSGAAQPVAVRRSGAPSPVTGRAVTEPATGPVLQADREEVRRAVANLVDNAVRHAGTRVRLAVERRGPSVVLVVTDDGPGVPEAEREKVFERFARLDDARDRDAGGTGLGLPIVRELVRRQGGTVRLTDAQPGPGLRAEIHLPA